MMEPSARPRDADDAGNAAPSPADLERLLRQLLHRVAEGPPTSDTGHDDTATAQEVVLDVRIDGRSYVLLRGAMPTLRSTVGLSPREKEIVRLVARGFPSKAIAAVLDVSSWTVATHLRRIFAKLGVNSRAEMVARVLEAGLLSDHDISSL